jgi:hypothetical protein
MEDVAMKSMDDNGHSGQPGGQTANGTSLGCVSVHDVGTMVSEKAIELDKCPPVLQRADLPSQFGND